MWGGALKWELRNEQIRQTSPNKAFPSIKKKKKNCAEMEKRDNEINTFYRIYALIILSLSS